MLRLASSESEAYEVLSAHVEPKKTPLVEVQLHREAQKEWQAPQGFYGVMLFVISFFNIFCFHPYLEKVPIFYEQIFQMAWWKKPPTGGGYL